MESSSTSDATPIIVLDKPIVWIDLEMTGLDFEKE